MKTIEYDFELVKAEVLKRFKGAPDGVAGVMISLTIEVLKDLYGVDVTKST